MDEARRNLVKKLRAMGSEQAATWLLENCSISSPGYRYSDVVPHLSWKVADQFRLARHYLSNLPHPHGSIYEGFASFMSVPRFLQVIEEQIPRVPAERMSLLFYCLVPVLRDAIKSPRDEAAIMAFLARFGYRDFSEPQ